MREIKKENKKTKRKLILTELKIRGAEHFYAKKFVSN